MASCKLAAHLRLLLLQLCQQLLLHLCALGCGRDCIPCAVASWHHGLQPQGREGASTVHIST